MLAVMFFALIFGVALVDGRRIEAGGHGGAVGEPVRRLDDHHRVRDAAGPLCAVACLMFSMTARMGRGILVTLLWFVLTVILAAQPADVRRLFAGGSKVFARRSPARIFP